ncbi:hypothetical protein SLS53_004390 [Cytospora paraplurivora]|uniref:Uncharacterized protein n=1 Tax=Cytospora paraplurivora TaxID=2898453 RepID=A0AAN9U8C4_9PEZI
MAANMGNKKLNEMVDQQTERLAKMNLEIPTTNPLFADADDVTMTNVADDHTALNNHVVPKYTKRTPKPVRTSAIARMKREEHEAEKMVTRFKNCEENGQRTRSTIQEVTEPDEIAMTDAPPENALTNTNLSRSTCNKLPFLLQQCIPIVGMRYPDIDSSKPHSGQRWRKNDKIVWALWSQGGSKDTKVVQGLIVPVFDNATLNLQFGWLRPAMEDEGSFQGGENPEDNYSYEAPREQDVENMWDSFLRELWSQLPESNCKWARNLSEKRFASFFSFLADARVREIYYPKHDGREHPELVCAVTKFLDAAANNGTPWAMTHVELQNDKDD